MSGPLLGASWTRLRSKRSERRENGDIEMRLTDDHLHGGLTPSRAERFLAENARLRPAQHGAGERTIQDWELANGETLRLRLCNYKHATYCDLRRWYQTEGGELKPSPRGIRFNAELIEPLVEALTRVVEGAA